MSPTFPLPTAPGIVVTPWGEVASEGPAAWAEGPDVDEAWAEPETDQPEAEEFWIEPEAGTDESWADESWADESWADESWAEPENEEAGDLSGEDWVPGDDESGGEQVEMSAGSWGFGDLVRRGLGSAAVLAAVASGDRDVTALTNRVLWARHPELGGRRVRRDETKLAREWLHIRDHLVRPLLGNPPGRGARGPRQRLRTQALREAWAAYARRKDLMTTVDVLGQRVPVNPRITDAVQTLAAALTGTGYRADVVFGFSDRVISGTSRLSLHAFGLALDIDPRHNPHRRGLSGPARLSTGTTQEARRADVAADRADTSLTREQVDAVLAIRTADGLPVFFWAGAWATSPDSMHFQVDVTPAELARGLAGGIRSTGTAREVDGEGLAEYERDEAEDELSAEQPSDLEREDFSPIDFIKSVFRQPTVGFEFDVHYGPIPGLPASRLDTPLSTHSKAVDGFAIKLDGPRMEVNLRPFETTDADLKELKDTAKRISDLMAELHKACGDATPVDLPGFTGARPFTHPKFLDPIGKLAIGGKFTNCSVWSAPQATVTVRLSRVAKLVEKIKDSEGDGPGVALTGGSGTRMGVRSEALYRALREVRKARKASPFSDDLEGFLILLASYLWTSELTYRIPAPGERVNPSVHDYEQIGKAFLPINVKTPLPQVFDVLLSSADQKVFRDRFADGAARANLFRLARPGGATLADGDRKFLPPGRTFNGVVDVVHDFQKNVGGPWGPALGVVPTWNDLVEHTLDPNHRAWGQRLLLTHSKPFDVDKTRPRVLLELRRIGFVPVDRGKWTAFMLRIHRLARDLDR